MKMSEVLKLSKPFLHDSCFLCVAVTMVQEAPEEDKDRTREYIDKLIHPYGSVMRWLEGEWCINTRVATYRQKISYRKRWVNNMISILEKEGD